MYIKDTHIESTNENPEEMKALRPVQNLRVLEKYTSIVWRNNDKQSDVKLSI